MIKQGEEEALHAIFDMDTSGEVTKLDHYNHLQVNIYKLFKTVLSLNNEQHLEKLLIKSINSNKCSISF